MRSSLCIKRYLDKSGNGLQGYKVTRLQGHKATGLQGSKVTGQQGFEDKGYKIEVLESFPSLPSPLCALRPPLSVHCSLLTAHCSLLTAHCSQLTAHCSLFTVHCSLFTAHCSQLTALRLTPHVSRSYTRFRDSFGKVLKLFQAFNSNGKTVYKFTSQLELKAFIFLTHQISLSQNFHSHY
jgi:hypothetical protein